MSVDFSDVQEIVDVLDKMAKVGEKNTAKALKKAGTHVKKIEVSVAEKVHRPYSQDVGYKEIKRFGVKTGKRGSKYINIGIRAKLTAADKRRDKKNTEENKHRPTHWDKIKGLWYNNYGFFHNKSGNYIAGSNWIGQAYDDSIKGAYEIVRDEIEKGIE